MFKRFILFYLAAAAIWSLIVCSIIQWAFAPKRLEPPGDIELAPRGEETVRRLDARGGALLLEDLDESGSNLL